MSLGWAQVEYKDPGVPWYEPAEQVVRCKYCGVRFKAEPGRMHLSLVTLSLALAVFVYFEQGFVGWGKWVIGILLGVVVYLSILEADRPYVRIE